LQNRKRATPNSKDKSPKKQKILDRRRKRTYVKTGDAPEAVLGGNARTGKIRVGARSAMKQAKAL